VLVDTTEVATMGTDFVPDQATSAELIAAIRLLIKTLSDTCFLA
jgi:hypothetical protein